MNKLILSSIFLIISISIFSQDWKTYPYSPAGSLISFPGDEGRHTAEPEEWWYTAGHLTGATSGNHYSYMLTYFYHPELIFDGFRILNLSNDDTGLFADETVAVDYSILSTDRLNIQADVFLGGTETWRNKTDGLGNPLPFQYEISASGVNGSLNLDYDALKRPLIIADSGFLYQGDSYYTYYYSLTKNAVTGTITFDGLTESVSGSAWIDRQYGTINPNTGNQYEWFSVQLSNGMDINIWNIFTADDKVPDELKYKILAAYVDESNQFTTSDFEIERLRYYYTPDSVMCYSQEWRVSSLANNIDILISTLHSNNEVELPFRFYEGATTASGTVNGNAVSGIGFAELLHSYERPDILMTNDLQWNLTMPLSWQVNNPDDGNPLKFDLEYSTDMVNFLPVISELTDNFYNWSNPPLVKGDTCWVKLSAYSIDKTLTSTSIKKLYVNSTDNIEESIPQEKVLLYPNPSKGKITIEGENIQYIQVNDISGKIVYSSSNTTNKEVLDLENKSRGIYFVKVFSKKGTIVKLLVLD